MPTPNISSSSTPDLHAAAPQPAERTTAGSVHSAPTPRRSNASLPVGRPPSPTRPASSAGSHARSASSSSEPPADEREVAGIHSNLSSIFKPLDASLEKADIEPEQVVDAARKIEAATTASLADVLDIAARTPLPEGGEEAISEFIEGSSRGSTPVRSPSRESVREEHAPEPGPQTPAAQGSGSVSGKRKSRTPPRSVHSAEIQVHEAPRSDSPPPALRLSGEGVARAISGEAPPMHAPLAIRAPRAASSDSLAIRAVPGQQEGMHIVAAVIQDAAESPDFPPAHGDTEAVGRFKRAASLLTAVLRKVGANEEFTHSASKVGASVANVAVRNAAGVLLPTILRQFIGHGVQAAFEATNASSNVRTMVGVGMPAAAVASQALGWMRDRSHGTQTSTSVRSRAIMGLGTLAVGVAGAMTGGTSTAAANMVAFTAYTAWRDLFSNCLLRFVNPAMAEHTTQGYAMDAKHFAIISVLYGIDQALVNRGMTEFASPSGPAAALAGTAAGTVIANAVTRGVINWVGECAEDLMFQSIPAVRSWLNQNAEQGRESHPLQLGLTVEAESAHLKNAAMGPWAVRTGILSMTLGMVAMAERSDVLANNPELSKAVADIIIGATNCVLYEPFANAGSAQPGPRTEDDESLALTVPEVDIPLSQRDPQTIPSTHQA